MRGIYWLTSFEVPQNRNCSEFNVKFNVHLFLLNYRFQSHVTLTIDQEKLLLHEYRDLFIDKAVRNNRSKLAIANRHQER